MFDFSKLRDDQLDRLISLEGDLSQLSDEELEELIESQEGFTDLEAGFQRAGASFKLGIAGLLDSPDLAESARRELEDVQRQYTPDVPSFTDITGPLSGLEYVQEQLVTTLPQLAAQLGAGVVAGRLGGPRAAIAGATGVGTPFFAGMNIDRQMEEQNIGFEDAQVAKAYGVGVGQAALDALIGRTLGVFGTKRTAEEIAKAANRSRTERVARAIGRGAAVEAPTEAAQQALEIIQANPEKFYEFGPEVRAELLEAAVAGGLVGGVITAPTGLPTPKDQAKLKQQDLEDQLRTEAEETQGMLDNLARFRAVRGDPPETLRLRPPTEEELLYRDRAMEREAIALQGELPEQVAARKQKVIDEAVLGTRGQEITKALGLPPTATVEQVTARLDEQETRAIERMIARDERDLLNSIRDRNIQEAEKAKETGEALQLQEFERAIEERQRLEERSVTETVVAAEINRLQQDEAALREEILTDIISSAPEVVTDIEPMFKSVLGTGGLSTEITPSEQNIIDRAKDVQVAVKATPNDKKKVQKFFENKHGPQLQLFSKRLSEQKGRATRAQIRKYIDQGYTEQYNERVREIAKDLRKSLNQIGLSDVKLFTAGVISPEPESIAEGVAEARDGNLLIALATRIYDPQMSDAELKARLQEVMNHEIIHALKMSGVFTDAEYASLVKAAKSQKYVDRSRKERKFTYFDRAAALYSKDAVEVQEEEAVAELFRDWAAGRKKIGGRPLNLFQKIIKFFKTLGGKNYEEGFDDADKIFRQITAGEIGARDRRPISATELLNTRPNDELGTKKLSKRITLDEWLKKSAVKEPVYHATFTSFSAFDPQVTDDNAIHFAPEEDTGIARLEEVARFQQEKFEDEVVMFPRMIEARIQIEKPLRLPFDLGNWGDDGLWRIAFDEGKFMFKQSQSLNKIKYQIDTDPDIQTAKEAIQKAREQDGVTTFNLEPDDIWMALEGAGFDGIIYANEGEGFGLESYLVWNPQQIYVENVEPVQYGDLEYAYTYDDPKDSMTQEEIDAVSYRPIIGMQAPIDQTAIDQGTVRERLEMFKYGVKGSTPLSSPTALQRFDRLGDPLPTIEEVTQEKSLEQMGFASPSEYISYLDRQLDGLMEPEKKFSRRISAPTAESNPFNVNLDRTIIGFYPEEYEKPDGTQGFRLTGDRQYKPNSTLLLDAVKILHGKTSEALGTDRPVEYTEQNKESLARLMATEALKPLDTDTNAIGWYDEQIKNAKKILRLIDPRIFESDKNETIYDWALAVTSNGTLVEDNFAFAQEVFDFYIKNQRLPVKEWKKGGKRNEAMRKAFRFANDYEKLVNDGQVRGSFREFLSTEFSVKQLQKVIRDLNQEFNLNMSVPADENAETIVFGSYMGGPKIGQGFYQNIIGNYEPLTMDIWWMRMWNRLVNRPLAPQPTLAELRRKRTQTRDKLLELARGDISDPDTAVVRVVLGLDPFKFTTRSGPFKGALTDTGLTLSDLRKNDTFDQFVPAFNRAWNRYFSGYQSDNNRNPDKPQVFNDMDVLQDDIYGAVQATPANGTERQYMREVTKRAQELLRETGVDIEIADLQALLWYPEKNLFEAIGVKRKKGESTDYEKAARILAKKGGYNEKQIDEALSDTGSGTVDSGTTARRVDPRVYYEASERKFSRRRSDDVQRPRADRGVVDPSIRGGSRADREDPRLAYPVYESGRQGPEEGRSEYFGVHYTRQNDLESLDGEFHGTGRAGLELKRGKRDRVYFYIQEDADLPQAEQQLSRMPHGYGATLNNIYDVRKSRYIVEDVKNRNQGIFNADMFEDMVVSEGYDGYINHNFTPTKAVVLLGKNNVPVAQVLRERNRVTAEEIFEERPEQTGDRRRRLSRRAITPLEGAPQVQGGSGPIPEIVQAAVNYAAQNDIPFGRQARYVEIDEDLATRIAQAYAEMEDAPNDPKVREAYQSLIRQTEAQFQALEDAGYRFYFYDETNDPYDGNPMNAMRDLRQNKVMAIFQTTPEGYGPEGATFMQEINPLLRDSGRRWSYGSMDGPSRPVLMNDLFRAVHDTFGHGLEGAGFRARGEENAWQAHRKLYTGPAVGALTSETRGQNSYLNFGPDGAINRTAKIEDTIFAPQKIGLMPNFTWSEGVVEDRPRTAEEISSPELSDDTGKQKFSRRFSATASPAEFSDLAKQVIDSTQPDNMFDGFLRKLVGAAPGERVIDAFVRNNISRFEPGYKLDADVYGSAYDNADSVGRSMELSQQLPGRIQAMLNIGPIQTDKDGNISQVNDPDVKSLKEIFRPLLEGLSETEAQIAEANYYAYAVAKREKALRQTGRKGLPSIDDALLDKTIANAPSFYDQIYNDYQKFNAYTVKFALDSGLLTQEMADEFSKMAYVPFYRTFNTAEGTTDFSSALPRRAANALTKPGALDKELLGSTLKIEGSLIDNLMENNTSIISSALRNIAMQKTGQALERSNDPTWGEAVDPSKRGSNIMTYRVNGVEKAYKINDQPLWIAVSGLAPQQKDAYIKAAEIFSGILRTGVTSFPGFMLANLWRGKVDAYIKAGAPLDLLGTIPRMGDSIFAGQDTMDVKRITGFGGYGFGATPDQFGKSAARLIRTNGKLFGQDGLGIGDSARNLMDKINNFGEATEMEVRVALYQNLVNEGVSQREAAFQAMNLINYGRKGAGGGIIGSFVINRLLPAVPFLNARIQGLYRLVEDPRTPQDTRLDYIKAIMLRGTIVSAASVGLALMAMQDEQWDDERLENKVNYDIVYIGDTAIKLPRAFELGSIFGAIPVLTLDAIRKQDGDDLAKATGMILFNSFAFNPVSQVALPLLEVITGYDTFRMAPLEGQGLQSRLDEDRFYATTPYFYRFLSSYGGRFAGLSPIEIQQLMEGYLAGFATFPVAFLDSLLSITGAVPKKPSGVFGDPYVTDVGRALGLTRFFTVEGDQTSRFVQDFYTVRRDLDQLTKSIQDAADKNDTDRVNQLMARQDVPLGMRKVFNRAATQLTRINNELNAIMTSPTLSPAQKTEMMRKLRIEKNKLARQYVEAAKRASLI